MRFCGHVPSSAWNKNPKRHISSLLEKVVFLDLKRLLSPFPNGEKNFFSTLNVMISQMVRIESIRFGRHIDIEVSYKILRLEIPKLVQIFHYLACFQKGLFGGNFEQKHPHAFRGIYIFYFFIYFYKKNCTYI
jgi:hypothetical protein